MTAFVFLWDPARWSWPHVLLDELESTGTTRAAWSTGARRIGFATGDRAYLFKVNHRERGIVASGRIVAEDPDDPAAERSRRRDFVDVDWDCLLDIDDVLTRAELRAITGGSWLMQSSGARLTDHVGRLVAQAWDEHPPVAANSASRGSAGPGPGTRRPRP